MERPDLQASDAQLLAICAAFRAFADWLYANKQDLDDAEDGSWQLEATRIAMNRAFPDAGEYNMVYGFVNALAHCTDMGAREMAAMCRLIVRA